MILLKKQQSKIIKNNIMKAYIYENGKKVFFDDIMSEKRRFYFGCGFQERSDKSALFLSGIGCLYSVFTDENKRVYNDNENENGKEHCQINFENVNLK